VNYGASCFVCGPGREPGDGLRIFAGPVGERPLVAAGWTPHASLAGPDGAVAPEFVWSVLDCPSGIASMLLGELAVHVLGRLTARIFAPVATDAPSICAGWAIERDGRKLHTGSALFSATGQLLAGARAVWIASEQPWAATA
jgi:hypothetical protein